MLPKPTTCVYVCFFFTSSCDGLMKSHDRDDLLYFFQEQSCLLRGKSFDLKSSVLMCLFLLINLVTYLLPFIKSLPLNIKVSCV